MYHLTFGLCLKRLSSIWTMLLCPPRRMGVRSSFAEQTSRSHWYTSHAVLLSIPTFSATLVTGYSRDHKCRRRSHFCKVRWDSLKKLPCRMLFLVLQRGHHQLTPSVTSLLGFSCIWTLQRLQDWWLASKWWLLIYWIIPGVPPKAIGPISSRDILSFSPRVCIRRQNVRVCAEGETVATW